MVNEKIQLLSALIPLAQRARQIILEVYATEFCVDDKGGNDPVTIADRRVNALLCEELAKITPGVPIVAEESAEEEYADYISASAAFFVDPLDGTREFVARNGEFAVMIGLAEEGRAVAGLILAPTSGLLWTGVVGQGAEEHAPDGSRRPLRLHGGPSSLAEARLVVSRSRRSPELQAFLARNPPGELQILGSAGLKGAAVARGQSDLYLQFGGAGSLWDACAPDAIVRAAGGLYTHLDGASINYRGALEIEDGVLVAAPGLHASTLGLLR
ncbi:MAG: 3'(2'),5'-bisphosphate nucleotidase CysQ [Myxococcales bacterium]|nr:3'(2'),5'-bisphosphate nucleotidase CysQ [Polyangiaceae bacterium]MDW8250254.1 3'(2'),5'-bisphosphate nucleotidase CysQ [Myxococcales bacterium]